LGERTERIPIRTRSSADPDVTTQVTPAAPEPAPEYDTAEPDAAEPDTAGSDNAQPDTAQRAVAGSDNAQPDTAQPAVAGSDTTEDLSAVTETDAPIEEPPVHPVTGEPLRPPRDAVLVHLVWEGLLLVLLIGLVVAGLVLFPAFRSVDAARRVLGAAAFTGIPAMAFSFSLRGAVPNLAVVPLGVLGGSVFAAAVADHGLASGVAQALALSGIVGLVLGALVVGLRVPAWAASIAAGLLAAGLALSIAVGPVADVTRVPAFATDEFVLFAVFALLSIGTGVLCLVPAVRRTLGAYRQDVVWGRRGLVAGFVALGVLIVSSAVAGVGGVLFVLQTHIAGTGTRPPDLLFPLAAVLLGGASVYGRRVGVAGTVLGVLLLVTIRELWLLSGLGSDYAGSGGVLALAGIAAIVGLLATPLVEWAGRRAEARATT
jgi:ribose/xylose/arabinose/galactoside ABC-type transport system permease subunit